MRISQFVALLVLVAAVMGSNASVSLGQSAGGGSSRQAAIFENHGSHDIWVYVYHHGGFKSGISGLDFSKPLKAPTATTVFWLFIFSRRTEVIFMSLGMLLGSLAA